MTERLQPEAFEQRLRRASPEVATLARGARSLILENCPETFETVWGHQGTVGYGTGPKKMSEHYSWLQFARSYVQLGFNYGAELKDPGKLLEGTGAKMRHVKVRAAEDLQRRELRDLLQQAVRHRVPPPLPLGAEVPAAPARGTTRKATKPAAKATGAAKKKPAPTRAKRSSAKKSPGTKRAAATATKVTATRRTQR